MNKLFIYIETQNEIIDWLDSMGVENYTINNDLTVDVNGEVILSNKNLLEITVQFGVVMGNFSVSNNKKLKSLVGAPKKCEYFYCNGCTSLTSLNGVPEKCKRFYCHVCTSLKSLIGAPEKCQSFYCYNCGGKFTKKDVLKVCDAKEIWF